MKKRDFKDFLYDTNDIWLAIAILVIAALIIIWRIDVIMDYPKTLDKSSGTVTTTQEKASTSTDKSSKSDSKTESKIWDIVFSCIFCSRDHSLYSTITKSTWNDYSLDSIKNLCGIVII